MALLTDILDYVGSYDDVRAACGLDSDELSDTELALQIYRNHLGLALSDISGIYSPSTESKTLLEIYDVVDTDDIMMAQIQSLSIYSVASCVMKSAGLKAYKSMSDGKATKTRFSPESTYESTISSIETMLSYYRNNIYTLLGDSVGNVDLLSVVSPEVDLVVGEE